MGNLWVNAVSKSLLITGSILAGVATLSVLLFGDTVSVPNVLIVAGIGVALIIISFACSFFGILSPRKAVNWLVLGPIAGMSLSLFAFLPLVFIMAGFDSLKSSFGLWLTSNLSIFAYIAYLSMGILILYGIIFLVALFFPAIAEKIYLFFNRNKEHASEES